MSNVQYYCLELDDYSAVSFCSFGKCYFGTLEDIRAFIDSLDQEKPDSHRELVSAFRAYEEGRTEVTHHAAFQEVPLLTPVRLIHKETLVLEDYAWDHLNTWQCTYKMRCDRVETEHLWLEYEGRGFRAMKANFKNLQHEGVLGGWIAIGYMLWGFPCVLQGDSERFWNVIAEPEKGFKTIEELEQERLPIGEDGQCMSFNIWSQTASVNLL